MTRSIRCAGSIAAASCLVFFSCAVSDADFARSNPYDAGGKNWRCDGKPTLSVQLEPLWSDFNFDDSTGMIAARYRTADPNAPYDSTGLSVSIGSSLAGLSRVYTSPDTCGEYAFVGLKPATRYFCRFSATDSWDSATVIVDSFQTPSGSPPVRPTHPTSTNTTFGVVLGFVAGTAEKIRIWRADRPAGPYGVVGDTQCSASAAAQKFVDSIGDDAMRFYRIGAVNGFGTALAQGDLFGHRYAADLAVPSGVVVAYPDSHHVNVSWYSSSADSYEIYRADSLRGIFSKVGTAAAAWFCDTLRACKRHYYCVASVKGTRVGALSSPTTAGAVRPPYGLSASNAAFINSIHLSWTAVANGCGYFIYRKAVSAGEDSGVLIGQTTAASYDDGFDSTCSFAYAVAAYDLFGEPGPATGFVQGSTKPLEPPVAVSASQGQYPRRILVSWNPVNGVKSYIVFHGLSSGAAMTPLDTVESTSFDHAINDGFTHYYAVSSLVSKIRSAKSAVAQGSAKRIPAPTALYASQGTYHHAVHIAWSAAAGAAQYYIFRSDDSSAGSFVLIDSTAALLYSDSVSTAAHDFYYQIAAGTSAGDLGEHSMTCGGYAYRNPAPTNIDAGDGTLQGRIQITWSGIPEAQAYIVYRSATSFGPFLRITSVSGPVAVDSSIGSSNRYYYYKVSMVDSLGTEGMLSDYDRGYGMAATGL